MATASIKRRLAELEELAKARIAADIFLPWQECPASLIARHEAFEAELNATEGNRFEWLCQNVHRIPRRPLKPGKKLRQGVTLREMEELDADELARLELRRARQMYDVVKEGVRRC